MFVVVKRHLSMFTDREWESAIEVVASGSKVTDHQSGADFYQVFENWTEPNITISFILTHVHCQSSC